MIAFDKQHLRHRLAHFVQRGRVVADLLSGHCGHGAGRYTLAGDIDHTKLTTAMRRKPLPVAQMWDVDTGCQCRIHDGLPSLERDLLAIYCDGILSDGILFYVRAHIATLI